jgi:hypothetical protein
MTMWPSHVRFVPSSARGGTTAGFRAVALALALLTLAGLTGPATAAPDEAGPAQEHLHRAAAATNLGNYFEAAKEYEAAYMQTSDPNLLVHVGQTWQLAGDRPKALTAFRSYVRVAPDGEHRALCAAKIRELEGPPAPPAMAAPLPGSPVPPMTAYPSPSAPPPMPAPAPTVAVPPPPLSYAAQPAPTAATTWVAVWYARDRDLAMPTTTFGTKRY